jgi:hypothetical protein
MMEETGIDFVSEEFKLQKRKLSYDEVDKLS